MYPYLPPDFRTVSNIPKLPIPLVVLKHEQDIIRNFVRVSVGFYMSLTGY